MIYIVVIDTIGCMRVTRFAIYDDTLGQLITTQEELTRNVKMNSEGATNCRLSNSAQIERCNIAWRVWGMPPSC